MASAPAPAPASTAAAEQHSVVWLAVQDAGTSAATVSLGGAGLDGGKESLGRKSAGQLSISLGRKALTETPSDSSHWTGVWKRSAMVGSGCLCMIASGAVFAFSVLNDSLQSKLGYTSTDLNIISGVGMAAAYSPHVFVGPLFDKFGPRWTIFVGSIVSTFGYLLMYLAFNKQIAWSAGLMALYYAIATTGSCFGYMAATAGNARNFPARLTGMTLGVLTFFFGLSGVFYSQAFQLFFEDDPSSYLLFLMISVAVIYVLFACCIFDAPYQGIKGSKPHSENEIALSPLGILKTRIFWFYAVAFVFYQSNTYMSNVSLIIDAATYSSKNSYATATQLSILSFSQAASRLIFGFFMDLMARLKTSVDRSVLFIVAHVLLLVHTVIFTLGMTSNAWIWIASITAGVGYGAVGAAYSTLTRDFFGMRYYGTACGFVMALCPIGIILSNIIFGKFLDVESARQENQDQKCYGSQCYSKSFLIALIIQLMVAVSSIIVFLIRSREKVEQKKREREAEKEISLS